jgi:hypothetical protein
MLAGPPRPSARIAKLTRTSEINTVGIAAP